LPSWAREDGADLIPRNGRRPLNELQLTVRDQRLGDNRGHDDRSMAVSCLGFNQLVLPVNALELFRYPQISHFKVDVLPAQAKSFTLSQTDGKRDRV